MTSRPNHPGVTLALGGGGARGLAHLGVLEVLEELGIGVRSIVGTSAGALVAAGYAMHPAARELTPRVLAYFDSSEFHRLGINTPLHRPGEAGSFQHLFRGFWRRKAMAALFKQGSIFRGGLLRSLVEGLVGPATFEEARIPVAITALDLRGGREVVLREGSLVEAALASTSVPGFFPPVEKEGFLLVDFGLLNRTPVRVAYELGGPPVVAVNVAAKLPPPGSLETGIEVILRTEEIGAQLVNGCTYREADLVLSPEVGHRYWLDFTNLDTAVARGREAAERAAEDLLALARRKGVRAGAPARRARAPRAGIQGSPLDPGPTSGPAASS